MKGTADMERLTYYDEFGNPCYRTTTYSEFHGGIVDSVISNSSEGKRLAAYEDTGLAPEQVKEMASNVMTSIRKCNMPMAQIFRLSNELQAYLDTGLTPERVEKLAEAEKNGRILPE